METLITTILLEKRDDMNGERDEEVPWSEWVAWYHCGSIMNVWLEQEGRLIIREIREGKSNFLFWIFPYEMTGYIRAYILSSTAAIKYIVPEKCLSLIKFYPALGEVDS